MPGRCPRCAGVGRLHEWLVERKVAGLAFCWARVWLLCHLCAGDGRVSERTERKWRLKRTGEAA